MDAGVQHFRESQADAVDWRMCSWLCRGVNFRALEELFRLRDERSNDTTYTLQVRIPAYQLSDPLVIYSDSSRG